jgi:hypothetical protein
MTITVPSAPMGPATPSGGWTVEFADGFGLPLLDGHSATNRASTTKDGKWSFLGVGTPISGFNANEIQMFDAGQITQDSRGLVLTAKYAPNFGTSKYGTFVTTSAAHCSQP